jgi:hypothetical protein
MLFRIIIHKQISRFIVPAFWLALLMISCNDNDGVSGKSGPLTEAEVKDFITAYDKAWSERDTTSMKEMMDEKYTYFSSGGATRTRKNIIDWFTPADKYKVESALRNEIAVTINQNVAIVSSHWVGNGSFGTETFNDDQRCGLVIQKIDGRLKLVAEHCVQITK